MDRVDRRILLEQLRVVRKSTAAFDLELRTARTKINHDADARLLSNALRCPISNRLAQCYQPVRRTNITSIS